MPTKPNYLHRLSLVLCGFLGGFTLIIVAGWNLIFYPGDADPWLIWSLRRLPILLGLLCIMGAFLVLRQPVQDDPSCDEDDLDNMDGA